ncbi:hypothetical protein D3C71_1685030 [compost metagenome]
MFREKRGSEDSADLLGLDERWSEEFLDIEQDEHSGADGPYSKKVLGVKVGIQRWNRAQLLALQREHVRHAVHHNAYHPLADVEHDHHGEVVVLHALRAEPQFQP